MALTPSTGLSIDDQQQKSPHYNTAMRHPIRHSATAPAHESVSGEDLQTGVPVTDPMIPHPLLSQLMDLITIRARSKPAMPVNAESLGSAANR
jgi:hypothetical protein